MRAACLPPYVLPLYVLPMMLLLAAAPPGAAQPTANTTPPGNLADTLSAQGIRLHFVPAETRLQSPAPAAFEMPGLQRFWQRLSGQTGASGGNGVPPASTNAYETPSHWLQW